jgi:flagellar hook-associated protein 2
VDAYNAMVKAIQPLGSFDQTTQTAGPMLGDATLNGVQNDIRSALYSVVNTGSTTFNTLASVGITTNKDGSLSLDKTKLQSALASAPTAVSQLFSGTTGVAATLNTRINSELGSGGAIDSRSKTLIKQENALTDQTNKLNDQMTALTASLTQQYSHLNTLLSSLQSMSAYLSQQFNSLPKVQSST